MSELAKRVMYPDFYHYLLSLVGSHHCTLLQQAYRDYPCLAGEWVDLSEFTQYDIDEIDTYLRECRNPIAFAFCVHELVQRSCLTRAFDSHHIHFLASLLRARAYGVRVICYSS